MVKYKKSSKKPIIISIIAVLLVGVMSLSIFSIFNTDNKTISASKFKIGSVSSLSGEYLENNQSIFTPEAFKCQGLQIEKAFDAEGTFSVFYYDMLDKFIGSDKNIGSSKYVIPDEYKYAVTCRIVITPVLKEDQVSINSYQISGIVKDYKIKVSDNQDIENLDLFVGNDSNVKLLLDCSVSEIEGYSETNGLTKRITLSTDKKFTSLYIVSKIDLTNKELLSEKDGGNLLAIRFWQNPGFLISDFSVATVIINNGRYIYDFTDYVNSLIDSKKLKNLDFDFNYLKTAKPQIYVA